MRKMQLTEGPVAPTILKMAGGMLFGFVAMSAFNAVDTYFVGKIGSTELAAMSFTFPVVMFLNSIALGLGVGISSVVSRAIGAGDHHKVQRLTTDGLMLAVLIVLVISIAGILTIRPLFALLGAGGKTLDLIYSYMLVWYIGTPFVVIPMAGNNAIRATGDTFTPSMIMMISVFVNVLLDPLLIFGPGPFPEMGITGAALATVIARFTSLCASLCILAFREKLILFERPAPQVVFTSWKQIVYVGVPAAIVQVINPLSLGVITRLLSRFGEYTVAGFGAASRVDMLVLIIPMSLSVVMAPFAGQNWGARNIGRIREGFRFAGILSVIWGGLVFLAFLFLARPIIKLFSYDPNIISAGASYLNIVSISYGFFALTTISGQIFSALNRPFHSAGITLTRAFVIYLPLALLGGRLWQENGIFSATLITNILGGILGFLYLSFFLKKQHRISRNNPQPDSES
ncbi:MAG: MATE family efflux transporter [Spirochaetales bacterium]|nr:MATE family efflux transporter [Spirochaetales bacterium]